MPNGTQALLRTLVNAGVNVCFTNPGTSEMHFIAALDDVPEMRAVLTLFEGVATGAADGYGRMAEQPAATLLHLDCGLANGLANLHNARKGKTPIVNIVGDHATCHVQCDAQLRSEIEAIALYCSGWVRTSKDVETLCQDLSDAIQAAKEPPGRVATLIVPADVSWSECRSKAVALKRENPVIAANSTLLEVADALRRGGKTALLLGGRALREPGLIAAARIAAATGVKLFAESFPARFERGAGLPYVERVAYLAELVSVQLDGLENLILVDAKAPVSFFAYPGKKSYLPPKGCRVIELAPETRDVVGSLDRLCAHIGAEKNRPELQPPARPGRPVGRLKAEKVCKAIGNLLPENAIIVDEAQTSGTTLAMFTGGAPRHDVLTLTGGAIGQALPVAVGAAIACPHRTVLALVGDGTAMYTLQALWTMARERLNIVTIVFNNGAYDILNLELQRVGAKAAGARAKAQLDLTNPELNFVELAQGMGVSAVRATSTDSFVATLERAFANPGPHLIEVMIPSTFAGFKLKALPCLLGMLGYLPHPLARAIKRKVAP